MTHSQEGSNPFISDDLTLDQLCILYEALSAHNQDDTEEERNAFISDLTFNHGMSIEDAVEEYEAAQITPEEKITISSLMKDILIAMDIVEARDNAPEMIYDIEAFLKDQNSR